MSGQFATQCHDYHLGLDVSKRGPFKLKEDASQWLLPLMATMLPPNSRSNGSEYWGATTGEGMMAFG